MGRVVPPLPEKKYFGRFETHFLELRRSGLEQFLNRLTADPIFMNARPLMTFLQADEVAFARARSAGPTLIDQVIQALQVCVRTFFFSKLLLGYIPWKYLDSETLFHSFIFCAIVIILFSRIHWECWSQEVSNTISQPTRNWKILANDLRLSRLD
jgi:hypothetical protein